MKWPPDAGGGEWLHSQMLSMSAPNTQVRRPAAMECEVAIRKPARKTAVHRTPVAALAYVPMRDPFADAEVCESRRSLNPEWPAGAPPASITAWEPRKIDSAAS